MKKIIPIMMLVSMTSLAALTVSADDLTYTTFTQDVVEGIKARNAKIDELFANMDAVTEEELTEIYDDIVTAEYEILKKYSDVTFNDEEGDSYPGQKESLREAYMAGLEQQYDAIEESDIEKYIQNWERGYHQRACAFVEMLPDIDVSDISSTSEEMKELIGNAILDDSTGKPVKDIAILVQTLINIEEIDGDFGKGSCAKLKSFQIENNLEMNGIVNEGLVKSMAEGFIRQGRKEEVQAIIDALADNPYTHLLTEAMTENE